MKLSEILHLDNIIPDLQSGDKKKVLEELASVISATYPYVGMDSLVRVLLERERLGSTGIGDGVAIPHGKFHGVNEPVISFGRSLKGVDFDSMDGQPVNIFFLLVAPENSASIHLKALARIARILKNAAFRKLLMEANTKEDLYQTIIQSDEEF
ncbi:MAG: PTS sugar transporter subunit IIA [Deltaproteobacteria bacterium]|jgi:PTS system nitrogen regulatory IIA component|nr:PTS sugar transporter subunit IIA [Deltaproteobacteria bacterium]